MVEQFGERLRRACDRAGAPACVGLDPIVSRLPAPLAVVAGASREAQAEAVTAFCVGVLDAIAGVVPVVKPQSAYFEQLGAPGHVALARVCAAARARGLLVLLDAKRGDIGSTADAYARATLDDDGPLGADAVTVSPYLGPEGLEPFVARCAHGKGVFVLVRTSNPGAGAWQGGPDAGVAREVAAWVRARNERLAPGVPLGPVGVVIGATVDEPGWRARLPNAWWLLPGFGAQGAGEAQIRALTAVGVPHGGALVVSARQVLYGDGGPEGDDWQVQVRHRAIALCEAARRATGGA